MLGFFRSSNPKTFVAHRRRHISEAVARRMGVTIRYGSAGWLVVWGFGSVLLHLSIYAGTSDAFLTEVGVAQTFLHLYMGLLGTALLVQIRHQHLKPKLS